MACQKKKFLFFLAYFYYKKEFRKKFFLLKFHVHFLYSQEPQLDHHHHQLIVKLMGSALRGTNYPTNKNILFIFSAVRSNKNLDKQMFSSLNQVHFLVVNYITEPQ